MVYVPDVNNNCPYFFDNPSLAQPGVGIHQSLNRPVLHHVDVICGRSVRQKNPGDAGVQ